MGAGVDGGSGLGEAGLELSQWRRGAWGPHECSARARPKLFSAASPAAPGQLRTPPALCSFPRSLYLLCHWVLWVSCPFRPPASPSAER